jgi:gluconolactonase
MSIFYLTRFGLCIALAACAAGHALAAEGETTEVKLRDLTLKVPADWKKEEPKSRLRLSQFSIPAAKGDQENAELAVFTFGAGGGIEANIRRWIGQFQPDQRKVAIFSGKSDQGQYVLVDLSGTYNKPIGPPIQQKTEPAPGTRAVNVILAIPEKGVYFLKLVGQDKTVSAQVDALRASFGAKADDEKEFKLDEGDNS